MAVDLLLGLQWGDEGKGKIVDVPQNTILLLVFKEVQMQDIP
jgi:adenylosuccinate synthase